VCVLYEPFPSQAFLDLLHRFVASGGTVVWSSLPPMLSAGGAPVGRDWLEEVFGVQVEETPDMLGLPLPCRQVNFSGALADVAPMMILTDFPVDRVFPVRPGEGAEPAATLRTGGASPLRCVGTLKRHPGGGQAVYLGFRPRDDQSASTGVEARTWFEILNSLGVYPASGKVVQNDNPTVIARTTPYLACRFPNGTLALCPHYAQHEETWPGGFFRKPEDDERALENNPPPTDRIELKDFRVAGQTVTYRGSHAVTWRSNAQGGLAAFAGEDCTGIELDGLTFAWSDQPLDIAWHPLGPEHQIPGLQALYRAWVNGEGRVRVPLGLDGAVGLEVWLGAHAPAWRGRKRSAPTQDHARAGYGLHTIPFELEGSRLILEVDEAIREHWLYVVRRG
jgi:hypothetical protein